MSRTSAALEERLREHVVTLAATIGERNVFRPEALAAARDYIEAVFAGQGYRVGRQTYEVRGVPCANLEATLPGGAKREQVLLLGAHYDSVSDRPGANALMSAFKTWRRTLPSPGASEVRERMSGPCMAGDRAERRR